MDKDARLEILGAQLDMLHSLLKIMGTEDSLCEIDDLCAVAGLINETCKAMQAEDKLFSL